MYHMVLLIINNLEQVPDVLDAWEETKVPGITILDSTGLGAVRRATGIRDDVPMMPSLSDLLRSKEHHHRTIFTVVEGEEMVDRLVERTRQVLGDLEQPENGVMFVIPVARVVGLRGAQQRARK